MNSFTGRASQKYTQNDPIRNYSDVIKGEGGRHVLSCKRVKQYLKLFL